MSNLPIDSNGSDKEKVLAAFGGKKGLIDSGIPSIIFLLVFNLADDLRKALIASLIVSAFLTIIRLAKRDTIQHAISGLIGSLICAWFANRTGNASDLYIPKLLTNLGYGSVYLKVADKSGLWQRLLNRQLSGLADTRSLTWANPWRKFILAKRSGAGSSI